MRNKICNISDFFEVINELYSLCMYNRHDQYWQIDNQMISVAQNCIKKLDLEIIKVVKYSSRCNFVRPKTSEKFLFGKWQNSTMSIKNVKWCLYTRKLWYEHYTPSYLLQNNLCDFTTREHKFKKWFIH